MPSLALFSLFQRTPSRRPLAVCFTLMTACLLVICLTSLLYGAGSVSPAQAWQTLLGQGTSESQFIVYELRLPRTLVGLVVGIALGVAGALMQAVARNPLAEPGLLGVSSGASFAVAVALMMGASAATLALGVAQLGALLGCFFVMFASRLQGQFKDPVRLVLAGAALTSLLTALTSILLMYDLRAADEIRFWVTGSVAGRSLDNLLILLPSLIIALLLTLYIARPLAAMALGEQVALGLGHHPRRIRYIVMFVVALLAGAATAIAGPILFVGLVVPFAARAIVGPDIRRTLIMCLPIGPLMIVSADILTRVIAEPTEMPLGVLTAIVGAPVLMMIVRAKRLPTLA